MVMVMVMVMDGQPPNGGDCNDLCGRGRHRDAFFKQRGRRWGAYVDRTFAAVDESVLTERTISSLKRKQTSYIFFGVNAVVISKARPTRLITHWVRKEPGVLCASFC